MSNRNAMRPPGGLPLNGAHLLNRPAPPTQLNIQWVEQIGRIPPFVGASTVVVNGQPAFFGGMTKRLAVAAQLMGRGGVEPAIRALGPDDDPQCQLAEMAQRALAAADVLIAIEEAERHRQEA